MESEIVRVVSRSTMEISQITRLKIRSFASVYPNSLPKDKNLRPVETQKFAEEISKVAEMSKCVNELTKWCFTPLSTVFQSYHGDSSHYSCLSWVSTVLGWGSEVSCPRTLP